MNNDFSIMTYLVYNSSQSNKKVLFDKHFREKIYIDIKNTPLSSINLTDERFIEIRKTLNSPKHLPSFFKILFKFYKTYSKETTDSNKELNIIIYESLKDYMQLICLTLNIMLVYTAKIIMVDMKYSNSNKLITYKNKLRRLGLIAIPLNTMNILMSLMPNLSYEDEVNKQNEMIIKKYKKLNEHKLI